MPDPTTSAAHRSCADPNRHYGACGSKNSGGCLDAATTTKETRMGFDAKYGQVTTEHGDIPADEPVIVFRARDITTPDLLAYYLMRCAKKGSPKRHLDLIVGTIERFRAWQGDNPERVKVPDSERSRAWMP